MQGTPAGRGAAPIMDRMDTPAAKPLAVPERSPLLLAGLAGAALSIAVTLLIGWMGWGQPGTEAYETYELLNRVAVLPMLLMIAVPGALLGRPSIRDERRGSIAAVALLVGLLAMAIGTSGEFWIFTDQPYGGSGSEGRIMSYILGTFLGGMVALIALALLGSWACGAAPCPMDRADARRPARGARDPAVHTAVAVPRDSRRGGAPRHRPPGHGPMRALVHDRYGGADVLRFEHLPDPQPVGDQMLVRVHAVSLNAADIDYLHGRPGLLRPFAGLRRPRNRRLGVDVAGRVEAIGDAVTRFRPGDEVFADLFSHGLGSLSELVCASERAFLAKPASMSMGEAATLPHAAVLALQGLRAGHAPRTGERILINGASGNVGPFAVQIARAHGMHVTGVASGRKLDFVRSIGADEVVDYERESFTRSGRRWDRILDISANRSPFEVRKVLTRDGTYTVLGGTTSSLLQAMVFFPATKLTRQRMGLNFVWKPFHAPDVETLVAMVAAGTLKPIIDRSFGFEDAIEAVRYLDEGRARGKLVIRMSEGT